MATSAFGFAGIVVQQAAQTRRELRRVNERVELVAQTSEEARSEASTAARQTVATGNGHASRVEGSLQQVLDRMDRMQELVGDVRSEFGAELRGVRKDVATVQQAINTHLNSHADADVRRTG